LSVRSMGTGEIVPSPVAKNGVTCFVENDDFFVVRNFKVLASKWLKCEAPESPKDIQAVVEKQESPTTENTSVANRTDSNVSMSEEEPESEEVAYDLTTDMAYHNSTEVEGAELVRKALTPEEESSMPDAFMPLRHYRAEKGDVEKAIMTIKRTLKWRKEFQVDKLVSSLEDDKKKSKAEKEAQEEDFAAILRKESETGKIYVRGYDKDGRAMMYMRPGNENTMHETNNMRNLVFQIEKAVACSNKNGHGKICLVIDYEGFSITKTPSMSASKNTLTILQQHFCERMYRVYICNPPFVFRSFYAMIKPFVDPVTKQKICWAVGKNGMEQIVNDVGGKEKAANQLEKCCGGPGVRDFDSGEYNLLPLAIAFDENKAY